MKAYYNEIEPFPAQWLRNLAAANRITPGFVDERSIADVQPPALDGFTRAHFFAGLGGWEEALRLAGWPAASPVWTGSCPCQPFSAAGKRGGATDERHLWPAFYRLIAECGPPVVFGEQVASADGRAWLAAVRADLEALGYAVGAADLCAAGVGAPHIRQRLYWVAHRPADGRIEERAERRGSAGRSGEEGRPAGSRLRGAPDAARLDDSTGTRHERAQRGPKGQARDEARVRLPGAGRTNCAVADADGSRRGPGRSGEEGDGQDAAREQPSGLRADRADGPWSTLEWLPCSDGKARPTQPGIFPLAHGIPGRVGQLRAAGNAIVPQTGAAFVKAFMQSRESCM